MGTNVGRYQNETLDTTNPLRRDTILIPAYSYTVLRFITDNRTLFLIYFSLFYFNLSIFGLTLRAFPAGLWAFHCHLAWHMAAGLLMQINSLPSKAAQLDFPRAIVDQCQSNAPSAG
jgi:hypothetical protein